MEVKSPNRIEWQKNPKLRSGGRAGQRAALECIIRTDFYLWGGN